MDYKTIEWAPGMRYFDCKPMRATLSTSSCANNWRRAQESDDSGLWRCRSCRIGAEHAGEEQANLWHSKGQMICSRCHQGATRLIHGDECVSCYNRQREFILGRNARGVYPSRMTRLVSRSLRVLVGSQPVTVKRPYSVDAVELMVQVLRDSRERVTFHFHAGEPTRGAQLSLF